MPRGKKAVAILASLTSLTASWNQPGAPPVPDPVKKSAEDLLARSKTVAARFQAAGGGGRGGGGGGGGGFGGPYVPPPVTQKIGRLISVIDNYSGAPTSFQLTETQDAAAQLQKDIAELNKLAADVPKLNKMISDAEALPTLILEREKCVTRIQARSNRVDVLHFVIRNSYITTSAIRLDVASRIPSPPLFFSG